MAARPGEVWAMERHKWQPETGLYPFNIAVAKGGRIETLGPKTGKRESVLPDEVIEAIQRVPLLDQRWLLPGNRRAALQLEVVAGLGQGAHALHPPTP